METRGQIMSQVCRLFVNTSLMMKMIIIGLSFSFFSVFHIGNSDQICRILSESRRLFVNMSLNNYDKRILVGLWGDGVGRRGGGGGAMKRVNKKIVPS